MTQKEYMNIVIDMAKTNIEEGGGPFAAIIVKEDKIIGRGVNRVTANNDPTAHAEVQAIRNACNQLKTFILDGCTIYSSCEPCPMCLGAIYWAHIDALCYGSGREDAAEAGFDDSLIYKEIDLPISKRRLITSVLMKEEANTVFDIWKKETNKTEY